MSDKQTYRNRPSKGLKFEMVNAFIIDFFPREKNKNQTPTGKGSNQIYVPQLIPPILGEKGVQAPEDTENTDKLHPVRIVEDRK
jgi:hypothetical protein